MSLRIDTAAVMEALPHLREHSDGPICAYVYDLTALHAHAAWMRAQLPADCELFYAAKANAERAAVPPLLDQDAPSAAAAAAAAGGGQRRLTSYMTSAQQVWGGPAAVAAPASAASSALPVAPLNWASPALLLVRHREMELLGGEFGGGSARWCVEQELTAAGTGYEAGGKRYRHVPP